MSNEERDQQVSILYETTKTLQIIYLSILKDKYEVLKKTVLKWSFFQFGILRNHSVVS